MDSLFSISKKLIDSTNESFQRSLMEEIDWSQRLIEIRGSRGVGKTTLMLQHAKKLQKKDVKLLYASLDTPYFFNNSLFDLADNATNFGVTHLFLDEVHRYPAKNKNSDWSLEIKNIYDSFPELNLVYSGSSILHLYKGKGDLSRRKAGYLMQGLSFREYLELHGILNQKAFGFQQILAEHENLALTITGKIKPIPHFKRYLKYGYYPFFDGDEDIYQNRLREIVNLIIDTDLPYVITISPNAREQLKRLLGAISTTVPYVPNMGKLSEAIQITDHRTLQKYLQLLDEAQLIKLLKSDSRGNKILQKPDKIYLNNTNLSHALGLTESNIGTERETFFYNQLSVTEQVHYSSAGDFIINHAAVFEVGGKQKSHDQIKGEKQGYVAADDIETGFHTKIPLWMFGFLY
jgi:uncharacterized protein